MLQQNGTNAEIYFCERIDIAAHQGSFRVQRFVQPIKDFREITTDQQTGYQVNQYIYGYLEKLLRSIFKNTGTSPKIVSSPPGFHLD